DDVDLALLDDEHVGAEVALVEDDFTGGVRCARFLDRIFSAGSLEDGFHGWTAACKTVSVPSDVLSRTAAPIGIRRLFPSCPKGRSRTTGIPYGSKVSCSKASISAGLPQPFNFPMITPWIFCSLPDRRRWVNIRSTRYVASSTSSQNQIPSSIQKSYGVPISAAISDKHPPKRTPSPSPSMTI